ncbi:hypothetical protein J8281_12260 [Aquimarina sp. U1-2]|uniref:hypothetical protein n=1 Tax=Aquimarina sp. U1-2 TaxID=2823141 RepID=UPI001AECC995|nr:hypothetical protein [Aquimarina sp. U1-2]MBP2832961.1 hypothetical protein [Aquimarina sp. U1-2]
MELDKLEKLLEKYFEGETTISEEKKLKVYFTRETVPSHLESYRDVFQYFSEESNITATRNIVFEKNKKTKYSWMIGVAACVVFITGMFLTKTTPSGSVDTYEDPEIALQETKKILNMVSQYMNEGKQGLVYLREFENTKNKFIK